MHENGDARLFWIALSAVPGVGRVTFRKLVTRFGSPERVFSSSADELSDVEGLPAKVIRGISAFDAWDEAEQEIEKARDAGVAIITMDDAAYPDNLRTIPDAPLYFYLLGALDPGDSAAVAIVGTRTPTHYGKSLARRMASDLASAGITIVSGMARGIDTEAHRGALGAGGRSIAVLGCGIDAAYPPENKGLKEELGRSGAVITEYPFGTKPEAGYFPARNRIISGLSRGTVIVEAAGDSGSLITAQYAREQQRKVFAVPGNVVSPVSKGANTLIKNGAILVESAADVLASLGSRTGPPAVSAQPLPDLSAGEHAVLSSLTLEPKHIDLLLTESRLAPGALSGVLMNLELKGLAKQLPGKYFIRDSA